MLSIYVNKWKNTITSSNNKNNEATIKNIYNLFENNRKELFSKNYLHSFACVSAWREHNIVRQLSAPTTFVAGNVMHNHNIKIMTKVISESHSPFINLPKPSIVTDTSSVLIKSVKFISLNLLNL